MSESSPSTKVEVMPSPPVNLDDPALFINRELSLLAFNRRVLDQAVDPSIPLLERLRFLSISCSNLDEFFEIRVAGLKQQLALSVASPGPDGTGATDVLRAVSKVAHELVDEQYRILNYVLSPLLEREGIRVLNRHSWSPRQQVWTRRYFMSEVLPVLTPVGLDPSHPFPRIANKSLNFIVSLAGMDAFGRSGRVAVVQAPRLLPRLIRLPAGIAEGPNDFVMLSSVISSHVAELFPGMEVTGSFQFRVTRNADLWVDEEDVDDLLHALKGELDRRRFMDAVRLEVNQNCTAEMMEFLLSQFELDSSDLYQVNGPVNLMRIAALCDAVDRPDLKFAPFTPGMPRVFAQSADIFEAVRRADIVLHHPYESFGPVADLVHAAARDPNVLAIKQTLYRTGKDSPMAESLIEAARQGKEVTAVIELRARFDEETNIDLATRLQNAGAKVVYGIVGYKTHAKLLLIVRREAGALRRYVHVGTGNYHARNTRIYTDVSLLTADERMGEDVHNVFQHLTGLGSISDMKLLLHAPFTLHETLLRLIEGEIDGAAKGKPARIVAKMNALVDPQIVKALYRASQSGVDVDLIVRGICVLRPGVPGASERIRVRSVVGRFLEHTRAFWFRAGGEDILLCSSADWMPRNFFRRVEIAFPIVDRELRERVIREELLLYLEDNSRAWIMQPDGHYVRAQPGDGAVRSAQDELLKALAEKT